MTERPTAMPIIPIFTIGLEMLPLLCPALEILSAINFSTLKEMRLRHKNNHLHGFICCLIFLSFLSYSQKSVSVKNYSTVTIGAQQFENYLPALGSKKVGIVTNITGVVGNTSIVDTLIKLKVRVKKIFGPEHGFRSDADAGELVKSNRDKKTGVLVISLYGSNKKPSREQLKDLDVLIYDIQDVGVRFYTYISTLTYVMEACAENGKELIVLDRPNPNGFYIDGPVLNDQFKSFLGLHNVPVVYGMTCGEYAMMVNEEGWLKNKVKCKLKVITLKNYDRNSSYLLPVKPSPNIPNEKAVLLYPSLGLFEGTLMSLGRGTGFPFQVIGHPDYPVKTFSFMPAPSSISKEPKYFNRVCFGQDLRDEYYLEQHPKKINLSWISSAYASLGREDFFDKNFNYHSGNAELQEQLKNKMPEDEIRKSWQAGIDLFKQTRKKYLLYPDLN
jgi:uncharacterized protein YbbC (DUF1343 family)